MKIKDYELFKTYVETFKITLLTPKYNNEECSGSTVFDFKCSCGTEYSLTYNKFYRLKHKLCPSCCKQIIKENKSEAKRRPIEDIFKIITDKKFNYISGEYINQKSKLTFMCECGRKFKRSVDSISKSTNKCMFCASSKKKEDTTTKINKLRNLNYHIVEYKSDKEVYIKCGCGVIDKRSYNSLISTKYIKCNDCQRSFTPLSIEEVEDKLPKNITWYNGVYKNQKSVLYLRCECGEEFKSRADSAFQSQYSCPKCYIKIQSRNMRKTMEEQGKYTPIDKINDKKLYYMAVNKYTNRSKKEMNLENISVGKNGNHIDHIYSKIQGFKDGILPCIIGSISNLRIISGLDNIKKGSKCDIEYHELIMRYEENLLQSST